MTQLSSIEHAVVADLAGRREAMMDMLERLVNIDSPTHHKPGVDAVGAELAAFLSGAGLVVETMPHATFGDAMHAALPGEGAHALVMGHMDTVFACGEARKRPFSSDGKRAYGPGVADMKGGLVVNAFVLAALALHARAIGFPLSGLFTADEEIASPSSREIIAKTARGARAIFNSEPGRPSGNVVTGRKGGLFMRFDVEGRASHSGSAYGEGISAIEEAARKIPLLHALTDLDRGITVNVGVIRGGTTLNTIAPDCHCEMDLRYIERVDREPLLARIRDITEQSMVPGSSTSLEIAGEFLPLEPSPQGKRLFELYLEAARAVGMNCGEEVSGGCADSGAASAQGTPTLCGTGPVGGGSHTREEYIELDSLVPRAQAMALSILRS